MNYTKEIDSIIDCLTEEDGGHAVGEGNIKEAVNELKTLKQALNIDLVSNCTELPKPYQWLKTEKFGINTGATYKEPRFTMRQCAGFIAEYTKKYCC